jgi:hypothetical protein
MRMHTASIVIGSLVLIGALPAAAGGQSTISPSASAPVRLAANGDATVDRDTYMQRARDEMQEWRRKLHDFSAKANANGKEAGNTAETDLNKAWTRTEAASRKLQTVGAEGWDHAKASFEQASHELADAWDRIRSRKLRSQGE